MDNKSAELRLRLASAIAFASAAGYPMVTLDDMLTSRRVEPPLPTEKDYDAIARAEQKRLRKRTRNVTLTPQKGETKGE